VKRRLRAAGLCKTYRGRQVVKDVDLEVCSGEVIGLLGPNGAGKTTSFYMVVGLVRPDQGKIYLDDMELTDLPMYRRARAGISYLPQEASVFRKMTVEENLLAVLETLNLSVSERRERKEQLLEDLRPSPMVMPCRGGNGGASKSLAPWSSSRPSSCSTNRLPASIPSR
jgi:lipopolysaccharide export system ATP-binding protein